MTNGYQVKDVLAGMRAALVREERGHQAAVVSLNDDLAVLGQAPWFRLWLAARAAKIEVLREWIKALEGVSP